MNKIESEIIEAILDLLDEIKALPVHQLIKFVEDYTGYGQSRVNAILDKHGRNNSYLLNDYMVQLSNFHDLDRKVTIALWVFMEYVGTPTFLFHRAKWPATLLFRIKNDYNLYRISVCDDPAYDADLDALKQIESDIHCIDIIASTFPLDTISSKILPDKDFIFAKVNGDFVSSSPEIVIEKIKR